MSENNNNNKNEQINHYHQVRDWVDELGITTKSLPKKPNVEKAFILFWGKQRNQRAIQCLFPKNKKFMQLACIVRFPENIVPIFMKSKEKRVKFLFYMHQMALLKDFTHEVHFGKPGKGRKRGKENVKVPKNFKPFFAIHKKLWFGDLSLSGFENAFQTLGSLATHLGMYLQILLDEKVDVDTDLQDFSGKSLYS